MPARKAWQFFREHAGGWVGHNAETALHLARAEEIADDREWSITWESDHDVDWTDHENWCDGARAEAARERGVYEGGRCPGHEFSCAVLRNADGEVLGSLGGIIDAGYTYARVVASELALEALAEEESRARNDREAQSYLAL